MILVAALGIGIVWTRACWFSPNDFAAPRGGRDIRVELIQIPHRLRYLEGCAAALSIALLALRLSPPRPPRRALARQPGMAVFVAVAINLVLVALGILAQAAAAAIVRDPSVGSLFSIETLCYAYLLGDQLVPTISVSILLAWTMLVAGRQWKPEPSW